MVITRQQYLHVSLYILLHVPLRGHLHIILHIHYSPCSSSNMYLAHHCSYHLYIPLQNEKRKLCRPRFKYHVAKLHFEHNVQLEFTIEIHSSEQSSGSVFWPLGAVKHLQQLATRQRTSACSGLLFSSWISFFSLTRTHLNTLSSDLKDVFVLLFWGWQN